MFLEQIIIAEENELEQIIKQNQFSGQKDLINNLMKTMRCLGIEIQRKNPTEWNEFLDIALHSN